MGPDVPLREQNPTESPQLSLELKVHSDRILTHDPARVGAIVDDFIERRHAAARAALEEPRLEQRRFGVPQLERGRAVERNARAERALEALAEDVAMAPLRSEERRV